MTATRTDTGLDVVTGAFSYSGRAIAARLLGAGRSVRTLTGHPGRADGEPIEARPLDFDDPVSLVDSLRGVTTLYNTYWVRFARGRRDHECAVANSRTLFHAAARAGVDRIVHVSITNPSIESPYPYFRGKAEVERALAEVGLPYAVIRPAILFGGNGVLLNNIAWLLRHLPLFAIGGDGLYRIRPVHIDDLAELAVGLATGPDDVIVDAVGPETYTFQSLVEAIRGAVGSRARLVHVPGLMIPVLSTLLGYAVNDVLLTTDEYRAMADGLANVIGPGTGAIRVSDWLAENAAWLGTDYANELDIHFRTPGKPTER